MTKIVQHAALGLFASKDIFVDIYNDVAECAKNAENDLYKFSTCIKTKSWCGWLSEKVYHMMHKFAHDHNMVDRDVSPRKISSTNVISIGDAMLIAASYGRQLRGETATVTYSRSVCASITAMQRRLIPGSMSCASLRKQAEDCKAEGDNVNTYGLVYNRSLMLTMLTRIYADKVLYDEDSKRTDELALMRTDGGDQTLEQVHLWASFFMKGLLPN